MRKILAFFAFEYSILNPRKMSLKNYFLSEAGLVKIANEISAAKNRQLTQTEIFSLRDMVSHIKANEFSRSEQAFIQYAAQLFLTWSKKSDNWKASYKVDSLHDYQKKQLNILAPSENQLKFTTLADSRGKALPVLEKEKKEFEANLGSLSSSQLNELMVKNLFRTNELIAGLLGPTSLEETLKRSVNSLTTFDNVSLPRRTILFDSRNRTQEQEIRWEIVPASRYGGIGQIFVHNTLQQIVEIRCSPFLLPLPVNNYNARFYKKIRMGISELNDQSIINSVSEGVNRNINYIFEFDAELLSDKPALLLTPTNVWKPNNVISSLTSLTVRFYAGEKITLDVDRLTCSISNANPAVITTSSAHNCSTGDLVYFSQSGNSALERESGFSITVLSSTTFSVLLDLSGLSDPLTGSVFLASKKIAIELCFISLER